MRRQFNFVLSFLVGMGLVGSLLWTEGTFGYGAKGGVGVLPPHSNAFGKSYAEWSEEWFQWFFSFPIDEHPLNDTADCSAGQSGKVWFLGGTFTFLDEPGGVIGIAERDCTIPTGKAIFFPIINAWCDSFNVGSNDEADLRACANGLADHITQAECTVDGISIEGLVEDFRVDSSLFSAGPLVEDNVMPAPAGSVVDVVGDGVYVMLAPLSKGEHQIHFQGEAVFTLEEDGFDFVFRLDITYNITVGKVK